jgi:enamine deaminase RidA (YjgF/YER057c/UK114 family)
MNALRIAAASSFRKAPLTLVQIRRDSIGDSALCEGIAALDKVPDRSPSFAGESVALVGPVRLVLTGAQLAFGREESDVRLAVDRLGKVLEGVGANWKSVTTLDTYSLFSAMTERFSAVRKNVIGGEAVNTVLVFEGLPSVDALLGVDAVAVVAR